VTGVFAPERDFEFIRLEVRRQLLEERQDLAELRRIVINLERAESNLLTLAERIPIPSDVKIAVWARDEGRCVMCGSGERLQFDHVIPVAKGGANSFENIQILCQACNLQKSDRIV
jgi:5-methylcytosine-specific restriction endonuclease McrA